MTEHAMSIDLRSMKQPTRPNGPRLLWAQKAAMVLVAVLVSSTLLGGMLSLFEMRSEEAAMARAPVKTAPSSDGLAARRVGSAPQS
jgi:hypothetical protein